MPFLWHSTTKPSVPVMERPRWAKFFMANLLAWASSMITVNGTALLCITWPNAITSCSPLAQLGVSKNGRSVSPISYSKPAGTAILRSVSTLRFLEISFMTSAVATSMQDSAIAVRYPRPSMSSMKKM